MSRNRQTTDSTAPAPTASLARTPQRAARFRSRFQLPDCTPRFTCPACGYCSTVRVNPATRYVRCRQSGCRRVWGYFVCLVQPPRGGNPAKLPSGFEWLVIPDDIFPAADPDHAPLEGMPAAPVILATELADAIRQRFADPRFDSMAGDGFDDPHPELDPAELPTPTVDDPLDAPDANIPAAVDALAARAKHPRRRAPAAVRRLRVNADTLIDEIDPAKRTAGRTAG